MAKNLTTPKLLSGNSQFCPGCGHGIIAKIIAQVLEERGVTDKAVQIYAVGCWEKLEYVQKQFDRVYYGSCHY